MEKIQHLCLSSLEEDVEDLIPLDDSTDIPEGKEAFYFGTAFLPSATPTTQADEQQWRNYFGMCLSTCTI
eukprot:2413233-Ditylum_brightwellii.AAC.1